MRSAFAVDRGMRFRWSAPDDESDSETSSDDGRPPGKTDRSRRRRRAGRQARFVNAAYPPPPPNPNAYVITQIPATNAPPPAQPTDFVAPGNRVPHLATITEGDVPGPFDLVPRGGPGWPMPGRPP
jgi:hypothetical protein